MLTAVLVPLLGDSFTMENNPGISIFSIITVILDVVAALLSELGLFREFVASTSEVGAHCSLQ